jgi:hypothetical protein
MENKTFSRKEFYDLVWSTPLTTLAKQFGISDSGIRKKCLKMNIPLPKSGHWAKVQFNKPVKIEKLPTDYTGTDKVSFSIRLEDTDEVISAHSKIQLLEKAIIEEEGEKLTVKERLTNPCKQVQDTKAAYSRKWNMHSSDSYVESYAKSLSIRVSKEMQERCLRFFDVFIKIMEKRGHQVNCSNRGTQLIIQGEEIEIYLREKTKRVEKISDRSWKEYDYINTGIMVFVARISWHNTEWKDGKLPLENQLAKIIAWLEIKGEELKLESIEREKRRIIAEEKRRKEEEFEKRREKELDKFKMLLHNFRFWREAEALRAYLSALESDAKQKNKLTDNFKKWLEWARKKADWYDPIVNAEDNLLYDDDKLKVNEEKKSDTYWRY